MDNTLDTLKADPKNPRTINKEQFDKLKAVLHEYGDLSGVVKNNTTGELVGGHMRLNAFREMGGNKSVQVTQRFDTPTRTGTVAIGYVLIDGEMFTYREVEWPRDKQGAANIAANAAGGEFDRDLLAQVVYELSQLENGQELLNLTALADDEISKLLDQVGAGEQEEDEAPEVDDVNPPISVLGEVYQLGRHRLMCGSATEQGDVEMLMGGVKADMVFTDPPYGVSYKNNMNDNFEVIKNDDVFLEFLPSLELSSKNNIHWYIWTSDPVYPKWRDYFKDYFKSTIIWSKGGGGIGDLTGDYARNYEMALFCQYGRKELIGLRSGGVWDIGKDGGTTYEHPTQKPVALSSYALKHSSKQNDVVLDLFGGSGSTLIACEQTNRICYMMELDPKYVDVIRKRYANHIGRDDWQEATPKIN